MVMITYLYTLAAVLLSFNDLFIAGNKNEN